MNIPKPKKRPWIHYSASGTWGRKQDQKIYKSARWRRVREIILSENPICGCGKVATVVDHIKPIREGGSVWSGTNLQSMCQSCHNSKTAKESNQ